MESTEYTEKQASLKCVDENEIVYDDTEKYLKRINSVSVQLLEESYGELLRNIHKCQEAFLMLLKQRIILCEPRVRYNPTNGITGLDEKIHALNLSPNLKSFLREISSIGYKCLKEERMLENLVEFDSEQPANVILFGKMVRLIGHFDMVTLIDKVNCGTLTSSKQEDLDQKPEQRKQSHTTGIKGYSGESPNSSPEQTKRTRRSKLKDNLSVDKFKDSHIKDIKGYSGDSPALSSESTKRANRPKFTDDLSTDKSSMNLGLCDRFVGTTDKSSLNLGQCDRFDRIVGTSSPIMQTVDVGQWERAVISVILTPRNYLYAVDLYNLIIYSYLNNITQFYCIVLHVGPLVDRQEIVLYKFKIPTKITELIKSFDRSTIIPETQEHVSQKFEVCLTIQKTHSLAHFDQSESRTHANVLDLNQLEALFRETFGARLQTAADLRLYFKYSIDDCQGVKDHLKDKKQRYERHVAKKEARKERKMNRELMTDKNSQTGHPNMGQSVAANASSY